MKKLLRIFVCILALAALCAMSASAKIIEGECGDYSTYSFDTSTGEMVISGSGDMWEFGMEERPWYEYIQDIKKLTLEEGITSIEGFCYCRNLAEVSLPSTLLTIGHWALSFTGIETLKIPSKVEYIGWSALRANTNLTSVTLPKSLKYLGAFAFMDCQSLKRITIPEGITVIEECTFWRCTNLKSAFLPKSIQSIEAGAFMYCFNLNSIRLKENVKTIKNDAFHSCYSLEKIVIPKSVTKIGADAFYRDGDFEYVVEYSGGYIRETNLPYLIDDNDSNGKVAPQKPDGNAKIRAELEATAAKEAEVTTTVTEETEVLPPEPVEIIEPEKADFDGDKTVTVKDAFSMITSTASGTVSVEDIMPLLKLLVS